MTARKRLPTRRFSQRLNDNLEGMIGLIQMIMRLDDPDGHLQYYIKHRVRRRLTPAQCRNPKAIYSRAVIRLIDHSVKEMYGLLPRQIKARAGKAKPIPKFNRNKLS